MAMVIFIDDTEEVPVTIWAALPQEPTRETLSEIFGGQSYTMTGADFIERLNAAT